jgi:hypothetical protein
VTHVAVLVPVRNEQVSLPRLIASIETSVAVAKELRPDIQWAVVFALDHCTDHSERIIDAAGYSVIHSVERGVGAARREAARLGIANLDGGDLRALWLANTDADSVVPWNWLIHQVDLAEAGAHLVVGSVRPILEDLDAERRLAWETTHRSGQALGHVHGANLGIRASTYCDAGGFAAVHEHEDVELVQRAIDRGAEAVATDAHSVMTSGRLIGRTAGGYASYLREELLPLAKRATHTSQPAVS